MPKIPKARRYEAALDHSEQLLEETSKTLDCPAFFRDANYVIRSLRKTRPRATHLALHMIAIAVKELMDRRGDGAKMALLMAQGLAEPGLNSTLMDLFCAVFHRNAAREHKPVEAAKHMMKAVTENFDEIMAMVEKGGGTIELPGGTATIMPVSSPHSGKPVNKKPKAKSLPPANPWN